MLMVLSVKTCNAALRHFGQWIPLRVTRPDGFRAAGYERATAHFVIRLYQFARDRASQCAPALPRYAIHQHLRVRVYRSADHLLR